MVKVVLHPYVTGAETQVEVEGADVGQCIQNVRKQIPDMEKLFAKPGKLKSYVEILVNGQSTYPKELAYPVQDGDTVNVLVFLSGG